MEITTNNLLSDLMRALSFAADKHRNQRRKDAEASPYINHPIDLVTRCVASPAVQGGEG